MKKGIFEKKIFKVIALFVIAVNLSCSPHQRIERIAEKYNLSQKWDTNIIISNVDTVVLQKTIIKKDTVFQYNENFKVQVKNDSIFIYNNSCDTVYLQKDIINIKPTKKEYNVLIFFILSMIAFAITILYIRWQQSKK